MKLSTVVFALVLTLLAYPCTVFALSSANIPLDSPIYLYLEKLAGYGLIETDVKGIRPFSKTEAARLLLEAEDRLEAGSYPPLAREFATRLRTLIPREANLYQQPDQAPTFDYNPFSQARLRYVYLDGVPRNYYRAVNDPGNDGVFGIGSGLRPPNPYPDPVQQRGSEGTPLFENNEGVVYGRGNNLDLRFDAEAYYKSSAALLLEPMFLYSQADGDSRVRLDKGYLKVGGEGAELEVGRDENWFGLGYRGALTLSNNAKNFDFVKISSPEPVKSRYLWDLKYSLLFSRFEKTVTDGMERQPWYVAGKLSFKPLEDLEFGINFGRQIGGPGVDNHAMEVLRGIVGGTSKDNTNSLAGFELRARLSWLRETEVFAEYSGEDAAAFWPIVESYLAGFYIPRLTDDGANDLRFEYFRGNNILYTNGTFVEGYLRDGLPIGHSQGGATQDFFLRYSHWFNPRNNLAFEGFRTSRGDAGRLPVDAAGTFDPNGTMEAVERTYAVRVHWMLPVAGDWNALLSWGHEWVENFNLKAGVNRSNELVRAELSYRY
ncbi:capsule assembly Wzi family protein [Geomonas sp. Red32]|uniref:capsule assembly Wzi family protein n=1 Tax=Geomonas sp. Red32 TaxID=2912856 RepID=UPI00202CB5A8|nr:capsule assembly Wzi family protein [Geomonas sp. Red32]MCM0081389.1 capsule assembly Wzi family protein [Geomonas sp. Red32]